MRRFIVVGHCEDNKLQRTEFVFLCAPTLPQLCPSYGNRLSAARFFKNFVHFYLNGICFLHYITLHNIELVFTNSTEAVGFSPITTLPPIKKHAGKAAITARAGI